MSLQDEHDIATKRPDVKEAYIKLTDAITGARTSMTDQGKPDRCPRCGSDTPEVTLCFAEYPCSFNHSNCTDWWHYSSPVPAAAPQPHSKSEYRRIKAQGGNVSAPNPRQVVTDAIREQEPKPTQLLALLSLHLSYGKIQDILSELLESGTVELGSDRRLRMVLRERPVPDKAESVPRPRISDLEAAMDEGKHIDIQPDGKVFVSDHPPRPTIDVLLSQIEAESVPSGKDVAHKWLDNKAGRPFSERHAFTDHNGRMWNLATLLSEYAAALAAERDQSQSETEFWQRELDNFRRNAAHRAEQIAAEKVAEAERSNSLLRERLNAAIRLFGEIETIDQPYLVFERDFWKRITDFAAQKENQ